MSDKQVGELRRELTSRQIGMISLGGAIGTGLFLGSSLAISMAGPATIIVYLVTALVAVALAYTLAEMMVVHPEAGGFGAVTARYLGPLASYVQRWCYLGTQVVTVGGEVVAAGLYVRFWWPQIPLWTVVVTFSVMIILVNLTAVRLFGELEYWFAMIKVTTLVVFILLGAAYVVFGLPGHAATGLSGWTGHGGFAPGGLHGMWLAITVATLSYGGVEAVAMTAAETRNPARDIPRAARRVALRLALFYVVATGIIVAVVPWTDAASAQGVTQSPFVHLFAVVGLPAAAGIMNFVVLTAALSAANTTLYLASRTLHSLGADGYAPRRLGVVTRQGSPANGVLASAAGLGVAAVAAIVWPDGAFTVLLGIALFSGMVAWLFIFASHLAFRYRRTAEGLPPSPVRMPGAPATTLLAAAFVILVLVTTAFTKPFALAWKVGLPFIAFVLLSYALTHKRVRRQRLGSDAMGDFPASVVAEDRT